jgi:hypothetical protein
MKEDLKKFFIYLLIKYSIGFFFAFREGQEFSYSSMNSEGLILAIFIFLFFPFIDLILFFPFIHFFLQKIRKTKVVLGIVGICFLIISEIYVTRKLSQDAYMEWHLWKGFLSLSVLVVVYNKTFTNIFQKKKETHSPNHT